MLTCVFISWKYERVNIHVTDFSQRETDAEGHILSPSLGMLFGVALALLSLSEDVL